MLQALDKVKHINGWILLIIVSLVSIGVMMLYSAANGSMHPWAFKQAIRFVVGFLFMVGVAVTDVRWLMVCAYPFYAFSLLLLFGVEFLGFIGMGAQRWLDLYIFNFQPSELMKIALILALAKYFHGLSLQEIYRIRSLILPACMIIVPVILVLRQPDLGTAMILLCSGAVLFFLSGVKWWKFAAIGAAGLASLPILWSRLHEYQKNRIWNFIYPESDILNTGYHVHQSKIALGSGGLFGKGFLKGTQSHLNFLPEKQTDFIFTMFAEEFGLFGASILILLYMLLIIYGYKVALQARTQFSRLLALGMTTILFVYAFVNIAMVMGILPAVGVPLPLVSYGGTALLTLLIGQGIIFSVELSHFRKLESYVL